MTNSNPPQPDITRTITETVEKLVHTYLAKIDKPRNNTELEAYNKKVNKLIELAVQKLVTLVQEARIDELKIAYIEIQKRDPEFDREYFKERIKDLNQ